MSLLDSRFHWNDRNEAFLRKHWLDWSSSWIAKQIGTTRSAVIGKGHRLGLPSKRGEIRRKSVRTTNFRWIVSDPTAHTRPSPYRPGIDPRPAIIARR